MDSGALPTPKWSWPEDTPEQPSEDVHQETAHAEPTASPQTTTATGDESNPQPSATTSSTQQQQQTPKERHYKPRTCRICLEVVEPTFDAPATDDSAAATAASLLSTAAAATTGRFFRPRPRVRYLSEDLALGRLISPCKCKGSQKYVHEGCLQAWRQQAGARGLASLASGSDRHFWRCPTCGFAYRLERLRWGRWIASRWTRALLTAAVFVLGLFVLGFVADPIIGLWLDPLGSLADSVTLGSVVGDVTLGDALREELAMEDPNSWSFHFFKGLLSLGFVGFVKTFFTLLPWQWTLHRYIGGGGGRRRGTGRDRMENINSGLVVVGTITFLAAAWKGISYVSARALEKLSENVVDIQATDEPDEDDEETPQQQNDSAPDESKKDK